MANTQYVFLDKARVPNRAVLQASIDALGFDLKLHDDLDLIDDVGFSPCVLEGIRDVGFELMPTSAKEATDDDEDFLAVAGGRDFCISMTWRGSMKDCAAVMIVSCALAKDADAVVSYEGDEPEPLERMIEGTHGVLEDARNES
jgi:hypothetical protein